MFFDFELAFPQFPIFSSEFLYKPIFGAQKEASNQVI